MILHFLCFGKLPYVGADQLNEENEDLDALREEISAWQGLDDKAKIRTDLPERLYHSLKTLIHPDPAVRPSAEDILLGIEQKISGEAPPMVWAAVCAPSSEQLANRVPEARIHVSAEGRFGNGRQPSLGFPEDIARRR